MRIIHTYEIDYAKTSMVIALFQPRDVSYQKLASLFPAARRFQFDDDFLRKQLLDHGAVIDEIDQALILFHRGGKIALKADTKTIVLWVAGPNAVDIKTLYK